MSDNLDDLCIWMTYLRLLFAKTMPWGKDARFHILIPAYRPLLITEALEFPKILQPLHLHGLKHDSKPYVQMNLHGADMKMLHGVDIWQRPRGWLGPFRQAEIPRVLGDVSVEAQEKVVGFIDTQMRRVTRRR